MVFDFGAVAIEGLDFTAEVDGLDEVPAEGLDEERDFLFE